MRCTDKLFRLLPFICLFMTVLCGCSAPDLAKNYEQLHYADEIYKDDFISNDLCFSKENVSLPQIPEFSDYVSAAALFDIDDTRTLYSSDVFKKIYPASTTKILTALVALENADMDDIVTVSAAADCYNFSWEEQTCGIYEGDQLTLGDLLYGLLLYSGNDNAIAIADYIGGDVASFADMMNAEAKRLLATGTHFVNPNGLHDENHYTTAYDLYLIFNECLKYPDFVKIISADCHTASITSASGEVRDVTWFPTNWYANGIVEYPTGATVIGGKTGTTDEAGNCLILYDKKDDDHQYISIVMGAETKDLLYAHMTEIIDAIPDSDN